MNLKSIFKLMSFAIVATSFFACGPSFEEQIKGDITYKMATGICDSIPKGSIISNIEIGEIVDIGLDGMTDVSIEFDYEFKGNTKHHSSAMLYIKNGSSYKLAALGACEYEMR